MLLLCKAESHFPLHFPDVKAWNFSGTIMQKLKQTLQFSIILATLSLTIELKPGHAPSEWCSHKPGQKRCTRSSHSFPTTKPRQTTASLKRQSASTYMQMPRLKFLWIGRNSAPHCHTLYLAIDTERLKTHLWKAETMCHVDTFSLIPLFQFARMKQIFSNLSTTNSIETNPK